MVNEAEHAGWRADIISNLEKASEEIGGMPSGEGSRARVHLAIETNRTISNVMIAERIGELALALNRNDEIVSELVDERDAGKKVVERLLKALDEMSNDLTESAKFAADVAESWMGASQQ